MADWQVQALVWLGATVVALGVGLISPVERSHRLRVWAAMVGACVAAYAFPNVWFYLAIDIVAAAVIMTHPKTLPQRAIGLCYIGMILLTSGFILRNLFGVQIFLSAAEEPTVLKSAHDFLSWLAVAILFAWGAGNALGTYRTGASGLGSVVATASRRIP